MAVVIRMRAAVVVTRGAEVLLVKHEKAGRRYWLLPGGGVEVGETLADAARRECREETGFEVTVGRLLLVCEAIGDDGSGPRHLVQLAFAGEITGGELTPGRDGRLVAAAWQPVRSLDSLAFMPPIGAHVATAVDEGLAGPVRHLGNVFAL